MSEGERHGACAQTISAFGGRWCRASSGVADCLAQDYPTKPVRIIVGAAPAGGIDILARLIGQRLTERLGQPFTIENRGGAASNIATEAVVRARADGYTLLMTDASPAINATLYDKLSFVFLRDIAPIACIMRTPQIVVINPKIPVKSVPSPMPKPILASSTWRRPVMARRRI